MRYRNIGDCLDFVDLKDAQIRLPPAILEQRVVIRTQVFRKGDSGYNAVEHQTKDHAVDVPSVDRESDDTPSKLIHDYHHPITLERNRLAAEQIDAPQTVFHVPKESQPRRAIPIALRTVILGKNTPHYVSINLNAEGFGNDEGNTGVAKAWIPAFEFDDGLNEFL